LQIPDPNPRQRIKVFSTVKTKNWIWDVHPGSLIWISSISDPDPGCRGLQAPDRGSGSATLHMTMFTVGIVSISGPECVRNLLCYDSVAGLRGSGSAKLLVAVLQMRDVYPGS